MDSPDPPKNLVTDGPLTIEDQVQNDIVQPCLYYSEVLFNDRVDWDDA